MVVIAIDLSTPNVFGSNLGEEFKKIQNNIEQFLATLSLFKVQHDELG